MESAHHRLRGRLNGVILQLEVARLALERGDRDMLEAAINSARDEAQRAASELVKQREEPE